MSLAEPSRAKPDYRRGVAANMRESFSQVRGVADDAWQRFVRAPRFTVPMGGKTFHVLTDRVRATPAVSPTLSMNIGLAAIGLGVWGMFFPHHVKRTLGLQAPAPVVQAVFGARELWSGYSLAGDPTKSGVLWARVAGDAFDLLALKALDSRTNPKRGTVRVALGLVLAVTALDVIAAARMSAVQRNAA
ncbi:hypothetical protein LJR219_004728 [Phenylobacterium sp. LjRoot219]|uniref:hypothetical protein n=1 Tax=Phenylobacterium sp. LjRoot219 TaxID=3342283 RepID=UPI003ECD4DE7